MLRILKLASGIQEAIFRGESKGGVTGIKVLMGLWATCSWSSGNFELHIAHPGKDQHSKY